MATNRKDNKGRVLNKGEIQRKDGSYMYRYTDITGQRLTIYAPNLNTLREREKQINITNALGVSTKKSPTLNEMIAKSLEIKKATLKPSTLYNYEGYWKKHVQNDIGKYKISDIKKTDMLLYMSKKKQQGLSVGSLKILFKVINPALTLAVEDNLIFKNPATGCLKNYHDEQEKKYALSYEQEIEFLERVKIKRPYMYCLFNIMLSTGLRVGEIIGLTWHDIDFDKNEISINHQFIKRQLKEGYTSYCSDSTKTPAGQRIIYMNDKIRKLFREQQKVWLATPNKNPNLEYNGYKDFIFLSRRTGNLFSEFSLNKTMKRIVEMNSERKIQLPNITPHILRHTFATRLAEAGIDIKVTQALLGHSDIKTTIKIYNHADSDRIKREFCRLDDLYNQFEKLG